MEYDFRNRQNPPYQYNNNNNNNNNNIYTQQQQPPYSSTSSSSSSMMYPNRLGQPFQSSHSLKVCSCQNCAPRIGQPPFHQHPSHSPRTGYNFRNRQNTPYQYNNNNMYTLPPPHSSTSSPSMRMYPNKVGQAAQPARIGQPTFHQQHPSHPYGLGIRVGINPKCRITPPPELSPITGDVPHSTFQFDFDFESKILAEAEKDNPNWSRLGLEGLPSRTSGPPSLGPFTDPLVNKYIALGLSREAVPLALANYGDNPTKVKEFVNGFTTLREMGFSSNNVAEALAMYDSDYQKALAYFLNNPS